MSPAGSDPGGQTGTWKHTHTHKHTADARRRPANERRGRVFCAEFRWGLLQPHTKGVLGQNTKSMEGFGFKYGEKGSEHGIRDQWEQGKVVPRLGKGKPMG